MGKYDDIFDGFENKSEAELFNLATKAMDNINKTIFKDVKNNEIKWKNFLTIIGSIICVDGKIDSDEKKLFDALFGTNLALKDFHDIFAEYGKPSIREAVDVFVDKVGKDYSIMLKKDIYTVCIVFAAFNGKITGDERKYLRKLID